MAVRSKRMRIGILGSGLMGGKLGTIFARAGHEVVFSYARSESKLKRLARLRSCTGKRGGGGGVRSVRVWRLDRCPHRVTRSLLGR